MSRLWLHLRPLALAAMGFALAGCSSIASTVAPSPSASDGFGDGTFTVTIETPGGPIHAGEAIDLRARLTYLGPAASILVTGPDSGLVSFDFHQEGGRLAMLAGSRLMCSGSVTLARGTPVEISPIKMAGWPSDDPDAPFYRAWIADPILRLPAGTWRITAHAEVFEGPTCMGAPNPHRFVLEKTILVED